MTFYLLFIHASTTESTKKERKEKKKKLEWDFPWEEVKCDQGLKLKTSCWKSKMRHSSSWFLIHEFLPLIIFFFLFVSPSMTLEKEVSESAMFFIVFFKKKTWRKSVTKKKKKFVKSMASSSSTTSTSIQPGLIVSELQSLVDNGLFHSCQLLVWFIFLFLIFFKFWEKNKKNWVSLKFSFWFSNCYYLIVDCLRIWTIWNCQF